MLRPLFSLATVSILALSCRLPTPEAGSESKYAVENGQKHFDIVGIGTETCAYYVEESESVVGSGIRAWLGGFISGLNLAADTGKTNIADVGHSLTPPDQTTEAEGAAGADAEEVAGADAEEVAAPNADDAAAPTAGETAADNDSREESSIRTFYKNFKKYCKKNPDTDIFRAVIAVLKPTGL